MNLYSEFDPHAAAWLRELIKEGLIPDGKVDERDIREIQAKDLEGFTQCHFFAGIGGWPHALRFSGWPDSLPVWTGSCPCQPFSAAGKRRGDADERHVWPEFFRLIAESRPSVVFGEQVASKDGLKWLDGVFTDLESADYACGAADLCAAGYGSPHIRQRLYWVADADGEGSQERIGDGPFQRGTGCTHKGKAVELRGDVGGLADADGRKPGNGGIQRGGQHGREPANCSSSRGGHWSGFDLIRCRDGKTRRIESGVFPLAYGVSGRMGLLRGYGNAIVPQVAEAFISAFLEARG